MKRYVKNLIEFYPVHVLLWATVCFWLAVGLVAWKVL